MNFITISFITATETTDIQLQSANHIKQFSRKWNFCKSVEWTTLALSTAASTATDGINSLQQSRCQSLDDRYSGAPSTCNRSLQESEDRDTRPHRAWFCHSFDGRCKYFECF